MRIAMLTWEFPPRIVGGLAMHVFDLSTALAQCGVDVTVITVKGQEGEAFEETNGVKVFRVYPYDIPSRDIVNWSIQLNVAMLEKAIHEVNRSGAFDIIHAHDWLAAFAGRALKHSFEVPLIATIHATEHGRNNGIHNDVQSDINNIEWWLTYEAWKVICCSHYMEDELKRVFSLPGDKIIHIPNGVHLERFHDRHLAPGFKNRFALPHEKIIYFVGRMVREKGIQVLIEAAVKVLRSVPDAKFVIAGSGPYEDYLRGKARDLGLGDKVLFTGYLGDEDRDSLYLAADVAVFPSLYEPFGIVALEAMAAGTPVIVSDSGGLAEIIDHEVDGLYAMTGSANSLADQIIRLLQDQALGRRLRENAADKVKNLYDWRVIAERTVEVYRTVQEENISRKHDFGPRPGQGFNSWSGYGYKEVIN